MVKVQVVIYDVNTDVTNVTTRDDNRYETDRLHQIPGNQIKYVRIGDTELNVRWNDARN